MDKKLFIDADIICYQAGFSSQTVFYEYDGRAYGGIRDARAAGGTDDTITRTVEPMPKRAALKMANDTMNGIMEACSSTDIECYLTGEGNFREQVATVSKYKGERHAPRPYHYQNIRDHLVSKYNAVIIEGMEADDAVVIRQEEVKGKGIIASRDKDLRQMYGYHYSWAAGDLQPEKPLYEISEEEGNRNYFSQMLTGDNVDNILGVVTQGPKKADKILSNLTTYKEMEEAVLDTYQMIYGAIAGPEGYVHYKSWDGRNMWKTPTEIAEEMGQLLWMLRNKDDVWRVNDAR